MKSRLLPLIVIIGLAAVVAAEGNAREVTDSGTGPNLRSKVWRCPSFIVYRGHSSVSGSYRYRARSVRRSRQVSCSKVRKLLKGTYGQGPLRPIRKQFIGNSGRPIYWFRGGWRCSNGAGGANCRNVRRPGLNVINLGYGTLKLAIYAEV